MDWVRFGKHFQLIVAFSITQPTLKLDSSLDICSFNEKKKKENDKMKSSD